MLASAVHSELKALPYQVPPRRCSSEANWRRDRWATTTGIEMAAISSSTVSTISGIASATTRNGATTACSCGTPIAAKK